MLRLFLIAATIALAPAGYAADAKQMEENKKRVTAFYDAAINQKDFEAAAKFIGPRYVQHNPRAEIYALRLVNLLLRESAFRAAVIH